MVLITTLSLPSELVTKPVNSGFNTLSFLRLALAMSKKYRYDHCWDHAIEQKINLLLDQLTRYIYRDNNLFKSSTMLSGPNL